jgi:hypothetical protein
MISNRILRICVLIVCVRIFQDLKKMKEKEAERERAEWTKEVLSDKNPHTVDYYKKKLETEKAEVSRKVILSVRRFFRIQI